MVLESLNPRSSLNPLAVAHEALVKHFDSKELARLLEYKFELSLGDIVSLDAKWPEVVHEVLKYFVRERDLRELMQAAKEERPNSRVFEQRCNQVLELLDKLPGETEQKTVNRVFGRNLLLFVVLLMLVALWVFCVFGAQSLKISVVVIIGILTSPIFAKKVPSWFLHAVDFRLALAFSTRRCTQFFIFLIPTLGLLSLFVGVVEAPEFDVMLDPVPSDHDAPAETETKTYDETLCSSWAAADPGPGSGETIRLEKNRRMIFATAPFWPRQVRISAPGRLDQVRAIAPWTSTKPELSWAPVLLFKPGGNLGVFGAPEGREFHLEVTRPGKPPLTYVVKNYQGRPLGAGLPAPPEGPTGSESLGGARMLTEVCVLPVQLDSTMRVRASIFNVSEEGELICVARQLNAAPPHAPRTSGEVVKLVVVPLVER